MSAWRWVVALAALVFDRLLRRRRRTVQSTERAPVAGRAREQEAREQEAREQEAREQETRVVARGRPSPRAELAVIALLVLAALASVGFIVVYSQYSAASLPNELLGGCISLALICIALSLGLFARHLVVTEEIDGEYPGEHPDDQREVAEIVRQSDSRITRKRLLIGAGSAAGGALGLAALAPALSLGPLWYTAPLFRTPWRPGRRLVDEHGRPIKAASIEEDSFYTAFPEGADMEEIGSPVVLVRLEPAALKLPPGRASWAPYGILAYSQICTHAGCAIALYRKPTFAPIEPKPALVCPCHYSTFNPASGGTVIFGPAGRPLPQLPLSIDAAGDLRAAGSFSGPVGPSWWAVRKGKAT